MPSGTQTFLESHGVLPHLRPPAAVGLSCLQGVRAEREMQLFLIMEKRFLLFKKEMLKDSFLI